MASTTPNIGLTLPTGAEKVSRQVINDNNAIIDSKMGAVPGGQNLQGEIDTLNSKFNDFVKIVDVSKSTGTISANSTIAITETATIPAGYKAIGVIPQYSGDDQFCWTSCTINVVTNLVTMTIRNCSSANDSGTASASVVCIKN